MQELPTKLLSEINELYSLTVEELQSRYASLFGKKTSIRAKAFLLRSIIHRLQENVYGGLSVGKKKILTQETEVPSPHSRKPSVQPGTRLLREYDGREYVVMVRGGREFEYDGCLYRSLSAIAEKITGTHWNGKRFFGVTK